MSKKETGYNFYNNAPNLFSDNEEESAFSQNMQAAQKKVEKQSKQQEVNQLADLFGLPNTIDNDYSQDYHSHQQ